MTTSNNSDNSNKHDPILSLFLRIYWFFGWIGVAFFIVKLNLDKNIDSVLALLLWPALYLSLVLVRYLDIFYYNGTTAEGEPASKVHFKSYTLKVIFVPVVGILFSLALNKTF